MCYAHVFPCMHVSHLITHFKNTRILHVEHVSHMEHTYSTWDQHILHAKRTCLALGPHVFSTQSAHVLYLNHMFFSLRIRHLVSACSLCILMYIHVLPSLHFWSMDMPFLHAIYMYVYSDFGLFFNQAHLYVITVYQSYNILLRPVCHLLHTYVAVQFACLCNIFFHL